MFANDAVPLIKMLGATGTVPGAISAEDLADGIRHLHTALRGAGPVAAAAKAQDDDDDDAAQAPIALATRAVPLVQLLERAAAQHAPVMWEQA